MYIKKITIQGFKTYRNTTIIEDLSPNLNTVVGRNGLGKSNFFSAIRFVLSDAYTHMTREERQGLIHEGSDTVLSAYVEIVFDNKDRRFPVPRDDVVVRRTIGLKKDDYAMDGRSVTRSDVMNLLDSAGFSRLNPYYIVPQGKITALTNSKDLERLLLLKEVSGAKTFDSKLRESSKEMTNSRYKMDRIDELMLKLAQKLADLQMELNDLLEYQRLDRQRKILEFNLFDRELHSLTTQIEAQDADYDRLVALSKKDLQLLEEREDSCTSLQNRIDEKTAQLQLASLDRALCHAEHNKVAESLARKGVHERELSKAIVAAEELAQGTSVRAQTVDALICANGTKLAESLPLLPDLKIREQGLQEQLAVLVREQRALYAKQALFLQFTTKSQRDAWLTSEISTLKSEVASRVAQLESDAATLASDQQSAAQCQEEIDRLTQSLQEPEYERLLEALEENVRVARQNHVRLVDQRKAQWRNEIRLKALVDLAENELTGANHRVVQSMDRLLVRALEAVRQIVERLNLQDSVYGPLVDLFSILDKYKTAVEVVAGNALFHVVVDTDETALVVINELARTNAGRITLMPLNRIEACAVEFPEQEEHEYIPLIKKMKFAEHFEPVMHQVFGRAVVCTNLQRGAELSRQHGLHAVTLDGDRADLRGLISGGFRQFKHLRMDALRLQAKKRAEVAGLRQEVTACAETLRDLAAQIQCESDTLETVARHLDEHRSSQEPQKLALSRALNQKAAVDKSIATRQKSLANADVVLRDFRAKISQCELQLVADFAPSLTDEELQQLQQVSARIADVEQQYNDVVEQNTQLETTVAKLEDENAQLRLQLKLLDAEHDPRVVSRQRFELQVVQEETEAFRAQAAGLETQLRESDSREQQLSGALKELTAELDKTNTQQAVTVKKLDSLGKKAQKMLAQKAIMGSRREELQAKIRGLGVLPEEAFQQDAFKLLSMDKLLASLTEVNTELRQYAHINKKAMNQYSTFARERESLVERKAELEESRESIERLVESLKQQKDSAIQKSFHEVSHSFSEIFETLVPAGRGQLKIVTRDDAGANDIDSYTGVSILVSFNSKKDEQQHIEQLSGGQKSLCAIALILAIQKCDPAPFYLFDEIDANLDTQYRTAVATILKTLAVNAQFICTTFRPEMLQVANTFYGVSFDNKVSTILEIGQEDALSFVEGQKLGRIALSAEL